MRRPRLSYANVMSTMAFFMAVGGVSYAATALPANSVGSTQLKDSAVTSSKIANATITSQKLNADTITALKGQKGDQGLRGLTGPQGVKGDTGAAGPLGAKGDTGSVGPQGSIGAAGGLSTAYELAPDGFEFKVGDLTNCKNSNYSAFGSCDFSASAVESKAVAGPEVPAGNYLAFLSYDAGGSVFVRWDSYSTGLIDGNGNGYRASCSLLDSGGATIYDLPSNRGDTLLPVLVTVGSSGLLRFKCGANVPSAVRWYGQGPNGGPIDATVNGGFKAWLVQIGQRRS